MEVTGTILAAIRVSYARSSRRCGGRSSPLSLPSSSSAVASARALSGGGRRRSLPSSPSREACACTPGAGDAGAICSRFRLPTRLVLSIPMGAPFFLFLFLFLFFLFRFLNCGLPSSPITSPPSPAGGQTAPPPPDSNWAESSRSRPPGAMRSPSPGVLRETAIPAPPKPELERGCLKVQPGLRPEKRLPMNECHQFPSLGCWFGRLREAPALLDSPRSSCVFPPPEISLAI
jgi:hypothetical protein